MSKTKAAVHSIETTTNVPINKRQYRFPEATKRHINDEIDEMRAQGIIKPSTSPWNAPVLCVPKKPDASGNKRHRIVVDFRALNEITKPFVYPIPLINEILDNVGGAKYFSSLDLKSGFYQVPIDPRDAAKTAFSTPKGHFEFTRMPMGLKNSPSTFQRLMNTVLFEIGDVKAFVYLDDIIVFGDTIEEHNANLRKVLMALRKHNLKIEPGKCQLLRREIEYLGHVVNENGIKPTNTNIKAIQNIKAPTTVRGVRSLLGTVNFYGKFIPGVAEIRKPLNDLLKKEARFIWSEECQNAFEELKRALISEPLLVRPNYSDTFVITTDASNYAIGAVLSNEKSMQQPIAYASRALVGAETRYHIIEKELLAIVWAVEYFRHYIFGQRFIVYTDHRPLIAIWRLKETSPTLTRLRLKLQGLECDIRYKQGRENVVADFLSRLPVENETRVEPKAQVAVVTRRQARQIKTPAAADNLDSTLAEMSNINIDDIATERRREEESETRMTHEDFVHAVTHDLIPSETVEISNKILEEDCTDARLVILNNQTAYKELETLYDLSHGINNYLDNGVIKMKNRNLAGFILDGKNNTLIDSKKFFEQFQNCIEKSMSMLEAAETIHLISFRKIKQNEILQIIQFFAGKIGKQIIFFNADKERINVTKEEVDIILNEFHDAPLGGHVGAKRMRQKIGSLYAWPNMRRDIENYVRQCDSCQKNKISRKNKIPMRITTTASEPFEKLYMDIVVLPESDWGNKYGLVMQDDLTRYLTIAPMPNQESYTVAETFVENYICKFGAPLELVTDNGTNFVSTLMKDVCKILKIKKITTSAYHPQANLVERSNRELKIYLRQFINGKPSSWDRHLPFFMFEYNTTTNNCTGFSPFQLLYGRAARIPTSIYKRSALTELSYDDYVHEMKKIFFDIHQNAKNNLILSKEKRKEIYDRSANDWQPMWGDLVLVKAVPTGPGQKLQETWRGPYEVVELPSEQSTVIKNGNKLERVHNNRLKRYYD